MFTEEDQLLNVAKEKVYVGFAGVKYASYLNSGLIMEMLSDVIDKIDFYKIFISFGIFVLFMTGVLMYISLASFIKCKYSKIIALIGSIICMMGYPLNSLLFGFEHMSLALLIICTIIHAIYYFEKEDLKFGYNVLIFALLNFGLFCSYYLFVPFVYSALWIYFCINSYKKNKKIICKENILILTITLLIPFFLGLFYHLMPNIYNILYTNEIEKAIKTSMEYTDNVVNNSFKAQGYIYINYYSNFLLFIPIIIYYLTKKEKEKKLLSFDLILLIATLICIKVFKIAKSLDLVTVYYIMKIYYALWIMVIYMSFRGLIYLFEKSKIKAIALIGIYIGIIIFNLIFIREELKPLAVNKNENPFNVVEIFNINRYLIFDKEEDLNQDEIELIKYVKENIDLEDAEVEFVGEYEQEYWIYSLIRYINYEEDLDKYSPQMKLVEKIRRVKNKIGRVDYVVYFSDTDRYKMIEDKLFKEGKVIYKNAGGGIIKYGE